MKTNTELVRLLKAYENAETSISEEQRLQDLLKLPENAAKYPEEAALFGFFETEKKHTQQFSFAENLFENQLVKSTNPTRKTLFLSSFLKYASILVVLLSTVFFVAQYQQQRQLEEATLAYQETKKALFIISQEMNNATRKLSKIEDVTQLTQQFINPLN